MAEGVRAGRGLRTGDSRRRSVFASPARPTTLSGPSETNSIWLDRRIFLGGREDQAGALRQAREHGRRPESGHLLNFRRVARLPEIAGCRSLCRSSRCRYRQSPAGASTNILQAQCWVGTRPALTWGLSRRPSCSRSCITLRTDGGGEMLLGNCFDKRARADRLTGLKVCLHKPPEDVAAALVHVGQGRRMRSSGRQLIRWVCGRPARRLFMRRLRNVARGGSTIGGASGRDARSRGRCETGVRDGCVRRVRCAGGDHGTERVAPRTGLGYKAPPISPHALRSALMRPSGRAPDELRPISIEPNADQACGGVVPDPLRRDPCAVHRQRR